MIQFVFRVYSLNFTLNRDKCHSIIFFRSRILPYRTYSIDGSPLARILQIKDLEIHYTHLFFNFVIILILW